MKFAAVASALVLVLALAYWALLGREEEAVPLAQPASAPLRVLAPRLSVKAATGVLTKRRAGAETQVHEGEALALDDELATGADSSATIATLGSSIALGAETRIALKAIEGDVLQFFVAGGTVAASSTGDRLEFFGAGTSGQVRVENAVARLLSDGVKGLVVASERGEVLVQNAGRALALAPGEATRIRGVTAPDKLWKVPSSILLKVQWPKDTELSSRRLRVSGHVSPNALVRIRNAQLQQASAPRALADANGDFVLDVALAEGANNLSLQSDDTLGKHQESRVKLEVDTTPADVGVETSPEMWKKR